MAAKSLNNRERLMTIEAAAEYLGITSKTLWLWYNDGIIPYVRIPGKNPKVDKNDLDDLIENNKSYAETSIIMNQLQKKFA